MFQTYTFLLLKTEVKNIYLPLSVSSVGYSFDAEESHLHDVKQNVSKIYFVLLLKTEIKNIYLPLSPSVANNTLLSSK